MANHFTDSDAIVKFLKGNIEDLTPKQLQLYDRLDAVDNWIKQHGSGAETANMIKERYKVSTAQAYRIISDTQYIFGSVRRSQKHYYRAMVLDALHKALRMAMNSLPDDEDQNKTLDPKILKSIADISAEIRRTVRYDQDDESDMPDWSAIGANPIEITTDPGLVGAKKVENLEERIREILQSPDDVLGIDDVEIM